MEHLEIFKALSNKTRLDILNWLKEPEASFPDQEPVGFQHGVCVGQIQQKAGLTQSTVSEYLSILQRRTCEIDARWAMDVLSAKRGSF
jgi:DNA-binding transcriptional ArsR family regulator